MKSNHETKKERKRERASSVNPFQPILFSFLLGFLLFSAGCGSDGDSNVTMMADAGPPGLRGTESLA